MASIDSDGKTVKIPPVQLGLPRHPFFGYKRTPSEERENNLKYELLKYDQRCLVTGTVSPQLQACHLVNTIRTEKCTPKVKKKREDLKKQVVRILRF